MIIRKPTKIELKPEDDFHEYEVYKDSIQKRTNIFRDQEMSNFSPDRKKVVFKASVAADLYKNSNSNNTIQNIQENQVQNQFGSITDLNFSPSWNSDILNSGLQSGGMQQQNINQGNQTDNNQINQFFSLLLNNINVDNNFIFQDQQNNQN